MQTVLSFVPLPDEVILGGASLFLVEDEAEGKRRPMTGHVGWSVDWPSVPLDDRHRQRDRLDPDLGAALLLNLEERAGLGVLPRQTSLLQRVGPVPPTLAPFIGPVGQRGAV